jgi:hypothetical protein
MSAAVHLFTPAEAMRNVSEAAIDYTLAKAGDKVTIEITDGSGKVVGSWMSAPAGKKPAEEDASDFRRGGVKAPTNKAGINRFAWDLHYPSAYAFPGMVLWSAERSGPLAVPGTYHVKLTAGGTTQTTDLTVLADSRIPGLTQDDLQKQFDLASKITSELTAADTIVSNIRSIRKQVEEQLKGSSDTALKSAADAMLAKQKTIEETVYQTQNRSDQDPLNFPIRLNNYIGALGRTVTSGDAAPTEQDYTVNAELASRLDAQQKAFDTTVSDDLAKVNAMLKAKKLKPVTVGLVTE